MKRLVYLSEATQDFSQRDVEDLASHSLTKNKSLNITGYLSYSKGRFVQYLEGESGVVTELANVIQKDSRHNYLHGVESNDFEERLFSTWNMRYISSEELKTYPLEDYIELKLLYLKNDFQYKERCEELLWKHVSGISKLREHVTN